MKGRILVNEVSNNVGQTVVMAGWVHVRRDQGKMVFFDLRDMSGILQCVVLPNHTDALEIAKDIRPEWVLKVTGIINKRPEKNINTAIVGGDVEMEVTGIEILNKAETPVFEIDKDSKEVGEEVRLKYRYLDLRTQRMQKNIRARFTIQKFIRDFLANEDFCEIETPLMSAPTLEGSRSYVVPSRLSQGMFYSLPQSPQQYKQLLMVAGFERYFQFAHCMRDEDTRGDRQPEFTQLDMEMSFVTPEEIMAINEKLLIDLVKKLYPEKKIQEIPFPRIKYKDSMDKYGNDRPDIREDKEDPNLLAFCWVTDFPAFEKTGDDNLDGTGEWTFTHNPFSKPQKEFEDDFIHKRNIGDILATQYDIILNGFEIGGGSIRNHTPELQRATFEIMGYNEERIEKSFGHIIKALEFGAPPHGGIAWGFDRFLMILENEPNIREVIPFAKTGEGKDLMMSAPAAISDKQLKELGIKIL
jgi:aspartyl-tRNA synthetase